MARISAEDCLLRLPNRFALCMVAAQRARQLASGSEPLVDCDNEVAVTSLREIAAGKVMANETLADVFSAHFAHVRDIEGQRGGTIGRGGVSRLARAK
jgi:DNA-directed RNA polymerase subunit omega